MILRLLIVAIFLLSSASSAVADCDFNEAKFLSEIRNVTNVTRVDVKVRRYKKWVENGLKIVADRNVNIRSKLKKKFKAEITVHYPFGTCQLFGEVRQHGDLKDHVAFDGGKLLQSLDVKLVDGNVANVVRFKLLLPKTRNSENEIFGTMLLKRLGFMAPSTALMDVQINGHGTKMLFQEKAAKEMIESLGRREGPLFEGYEGLLWTEKGLINANVWLSLSRLINAKWARKGKTSLDIALSAYERLQREHIRFSNFIKKNVAWYSLNPNEGNEGENIFSEYSLVLLAMNGIHGLSFDSRKYLWNSLRNYFEPIYYDGNLDLKSHWAGAGFEVLHFGPEFSQKFDQKRFSAAFRKLDSAALVEKIRQATNAAFVAEFAARSEMAPAQAEKFVVSARDVTVKNIQFIVKKSQTPVEVATDTFEVSYGEARSALARRLADFGYSTVEVDRKKQGSEYLLCDGLPGCENPVATSGSVAKIMSDLKDASGRKYVILPKTAGQIEDDEKVTSKIAGISISHVRSAKVAYNSRDRTIELIQTKPDDWFLIMDQELRGVKIRLTGLRPNQITSEEEQRFNRYGITGCLNFLNVTFDNTVLESSEGGCEDAINIVSSKGHISRVAIDGAMSDGLDADFSTLAFDSLDIKKTGNDCFDVSSGDYTLGQAVFSQCGDKGASIGEGSRFHAQKLDVRGANIGIASKDHSQATVKEADFDKTAVCGEAVKKKQEFGGAYLKLENVRCSGGKYLSDDRSVLLRGEGA